VKEYKAAGDEVAITIATLQAQHQKQLEEVEKDAINSIL
jgi:hypothetical protein